MGTPAFAVPTLKALRDAGHEILAVYSQPPRPAGRGHHEQKSPVHLFAEGLGLPVLTPSSLRGEEAQKTFASFQADAAVVVAYGLLLPKSVLEGTRLGCFNVHASLLPRWRGAGPIQRAIQAGDEKTGITIMKMDEGLDTGPMLWRDEVPISPEETAETLHDTLSLLGAKAIVPALEGYVTGTIVPQAQPEEGVLYARKLEKEERNPDWTQDARLIERTIRGFTPWPGVSFSIGGKPLKILKAKVVPATGRPGEVLDDLLTVACGKDALRLLQVQPSGKKPMPASDFLNGHAVPKGTLLS